MNYDSDCLVVKNNLQPVRYFVTLTALLINPHTKKIEICRNFFTLKVAWQLFVYRY
ncbi:hypothetical protein CRENPOLYSF2_1300004 [Crenothrix polyspora]|uniref:Uncharacterized protein n=1 Tax=Crenothrix polyspora TaxID=360316 RepID=A0A1R4H0G7_9GAMM|nr:hypothetical protein CRENPOLYSF2_1300004 [Crenothrix polyspora]